MHAPALARAGAFHPIELVEGEKLKLKETFSIARPLPGRRCTVE